MLEINKQQPITKANIIFMISRVKKLVFFFQSYKWDYVFHFRLNFSLVFTVEAHYEIILIELFFLSVKKSDDGCQNMGNCTRFGNRKTKSGALWSMAESISFPPGFLIWLLLRCETTTEPLLLMALLKHTAKSWSFQFTIIDLELSLLVESRESSHALRMRQGSM